MLHQPTGRKGRSPQRHKYPQECHRIVPSPSQTSPTIWGNQCGPDDRDCHTHTHTTSQNHCSQDCRDTIGPCNAPGPDIATVWTCPTPVYTHTERRCTNNTQSQRHRAVCPSATRMSTNGNTRRGKGTQGSISTGPVYHRPSSPLFGLVVGLVCPRHMVGLSQCVCAAVVTPPVGVRPIALFCGHAGRRRAHSTMVQALCVLCASPLGVGVDRRRACSHRRDVRPWCTAGANGVATVLGTMVLRGCVCVTIADVGPTMVTPEDRGGLGIRVRFGRTPW